MTVSLVLIVAGLQWHVGKIIGPKYMFNYCCLSAYFTSFKKMNLLLPHFRYVHVFTTTSIVYDTAGDVVTWGSLKRNLSSQKLISGVNPYFQTEEVCIVCGAVSSGSST